MEARNGDTGLAYLFGVVLLLITGWVAWDYYSPEWKDYQAGFRALITERFGAERAQAIPAELLEFDGGHYVPSQAIDRVAQMIANFDD